MILSSNFQFFIISLQFVIQRIGTMLKVKSANYFRDGRVVVESEGVGRFKGNKKIVFATPS